MSRRGNEAQFLMLPLHKAERQVRTFVKRSLIGSENSQVVVTTTQPASRDNRYPDEASEWLTASEAAEYLKVRTRTLLLWARQGKVKGHVLSGTRRHVWRFRLEDLDRALSAPVANVLKSPSSSVRSADMEAA